MPLFNRFLSLSIHSCTSRKPFRRHTKKLSSSPQAAYLVPESASNMPNTARAEKQKKPVTRRNLPMKQVKKNPIRTTGPERVGNSEVGVEAITLRIAPATDAAGRSRPLRFDSIDTGCPTSPIRTTNATSWPSSKHTISGIRRSEPRQRALPPSNPPSSSPIAASIMSV